MQVITKRFFILFVLVFAFGSEAYEQVRAGTIVRRRIVEVEDSIIYEEAEPAAKVSSFLRDMSGSWQITSMRKQPALPSEKLDGYILQIKTDSTFSGRTPCGSFSGTLKLRGTAIRFEPQKTAANACPQEAQDVFFIKLLKEAVVAFGVYPKSLELRDLSGKIIFEGIRP